MFAFMASRKTLLALTIVVIAAGLETVILQIGNFIDFFKVGGASLNLELEEDIALVLVVLGVIFEEREFFTRKRFGANIPEPEVRINEHARLSGSYCMLIGLVMEVLDQLFNTIATLGQAWLLLAAGAILLLHLVSMAILLQFLWTMAAPWFRGTARS
jgi:hypothetical protein